MKKASHNMWVGRGEAFGQVVWRIAANFDGSILMILHAGKKQKSRAQR